MPIAYKYDMAFIPDKGRAHKASDFGLRMVEYPTVPAAKKIYNTYTIPGRAGQLVQDTNTKENIIIPVTLVEITKEKDQFEYRDYIRQISGWLKGSGWLQFSDEQETRYKVLTVQVGQSQRNTPIYGAINMEFTIEPYEYATNGLNSHDAEVVTYNGYDLCKPLYEINGNATGTLTVNGNQFKINTIERLTIDSALMLAWKTVDGEVVSQVVAGDYEDLWLPNGENTITVTEGLQCKITPRWGWEL